MILQSCEEKDLSRKTTQLLCSGFFAVLCSGCAVYTPKPLSNTLLSDELGTPQEAQIRALVSDLPDPLLSTVVIDLSDGVGPDEAAVISVVLNPSLRAQRRSRGISSAEILNAGLLPDPVFSMSADFPSGGATAGTINAYGVGLDWAISDLITRRARVDAAQLSKGSVDLSILWSESLVSIQAKALVYSVASAQQADTLLSDEVSLLQENVVRIQEALDAGLMTEVDMAAALASHDVALTQRTILKEQLEQAQISLATLMGFPPDADIRVDVSLDDELDEPPSRLTELLKTMESNRLDLLALRQGYESQEAHVRAAILQQFPRLSIGPHFARDTGNLSTVGFGIGIELPIFNRNRGEIALARATRELLADEYAALVHEARSGLAEELNRLRFAQERLGTLRSAELSQETLVETYRLGLDRGLVDVLSYYQARRDMIEIRVAQTQTIADIHRSRLLIEVLSGDRWNLETENNTKQKESE
tara:strand:+ start:864 stop:2297 length:1434 start_codon:yes stop_codon:yes gene_type:complete